MSRPEAKQLSQLLAAASLPSEGVPDALCVTDIQTDSRSVRRGSLFVAYKGLERDGHQFIQEAIARGAAALICERRPEQPLPVPVVLVPDARRAWAVLSAAWHGFPSRHLRLAGVTGTDGKTTTASLLQHILDNAGTRTGLISTVCARIGQNTLDTGLHTTTPPPWQVQQLLSQMLLQRCRAAVIEATSEGLAQQRLVGCEFDLGIVTNITHDHLYYHGSFRAYRDAKAQLLRSLGKAFRKSGVPKVAILNKDDPNYHHLRQIPADKHISFGHHNADVCVSDLRSDVSGLSMTVRSPWGLAEVRSPMPGEYNAYNIAAAIAAACSWGVDLETATSAVSTFIGIPGRMEFIRMGQPFNVIIDFAHTPNALDNALGVARSWTCGRLIVVLGCAGERDVLKRKPMGRIAVTRADYSLFTAEDPRRESLEAILEQMSQGAREAGGREGYEFTLVPDRREAIRRAVRMARQGDTVILCGKGHERSMCYGRTEFPWSEHEAVRDALGQIGYGRHRHTLVGKLS